MEATGVLRPAVQVLAEVSALLDAVDPGVVSLSDAEQLALVGASVVVAGRVQALACHVAAGVAESGAADRQVGVPLASWLADTLRLTRGEAHRLIHTGHDLTRFPTLTEQTLAGTVGYTQATAIATVLKRLPDDFTPDQVARAEEQLIGYAAEHDSAGLARLSSRLVELLDPIGADEREERRLQRDLKAAKARRHLHLLSDGHGSILIRGSLPTVDAEPLVKLIDAYTLSARRRGWDRTDPLAEQTTPAMQRADALCALIDAHQRQSLAPSNGGDRPRIVVTLDYNQLLDTCRRAGALTTWDDTKQHQHRNGSTGPIDTPARGQGLMRATLLGSGEPITAGQLRQLACDAEILPIILGGKSEVLDVGRAQRLVTPPIRAALALRDQGCVFPGCDRPPDSCHAHHLTPWWAGGDTKLENLALLCPHHHGLVEPARNGPPSRRWEIRIGDQGVPEVLPPNYVDQTRQPRQNQRFRGTVSARDP